jgi:hypothetical protein
VSERVWMRRDQWEALERAVYALAERLERDRIRERVARVEERARLAEERAYAAQKGVRELVADGKRAEEARQDALAKAFEEDLARRLGVKVEELI